MTPKTDRARARNEALKAVLEKLDAMTPEAEAAFWTAALAEVEIVAAETGSVPKPAAAKPPARPKRAAAIEQADFASVGAGHATAADAHAIADADAVADAPANTRVAAPKKKAPPAQSPKTGKPKTAKTPAAETWVASAEFPLDDAARHVSVHSVHPVHSAPDAAPSPKPAKPGAPVAAKVYTDGCSKGNPGRAGAGWHIESADGKLNVEGCKDLGIMTNNEAEYMGLILALEDCLRLGVETLDLYTDSQLMARQIQGRYQVKNARIAKLHARAKSLLARFKRHRISDVRREFNARADELSNRALRGR